MAKKDYRLRCRFFYRWSPSEHQLGRYKPACGIRKIHLPCSKCRDCKYALDKVKFTKMNPKLSEADVDLVAMIVNGFNRN